MPDEIFMLKKLPSPITNIEDFIIRDYVYIDKTKFIEIYEEEQSTVSMFLRPRRFGKTTFLEILQYYYDQALQDRAKLFFKDTYIEQHPTPLKGKFKILKFDFSGVETNSSEEVVYKSFKNRVIQGIVDFLELYPEFIPKGDLAIWEAYDKIAKFPDLEQVGIFYSNNKDFKSASLVLDHFLLRLSTKLNPHNQDQKIMILIDEYDNFMNDLFTKNRELFHKLADKSGLLATFYGLLRNYKQRKTIDSIFITGILPITLDSVISGFVSRNLTFTTKFNEVAGLNITEVRQLLEETNNLPSMEDVVQDLKIKFEGYTFSQTSENKILNTTMCIDYILKLIDRKNTLPLLSINANSNIDYEKISTFLNLMEEADRNNLISLISHNTPIMANLDDAVPYTSNDQKLTFDQGVLIFLYLGFLTIIRQEELSLYIDYPSDSATYLIVPNEYFKLLFSKYILLNNRVNLSIIDQNERLYLGIVNHNEEFLKNSLSLLSQAFVNTDLTHENEACVAIAIYACFALKSSNFELIREYPIRINKKYLVQTSSNESYLSSKNYRADLVALNKDPTKESFLFEVKYKRNAPSSQETIAHEREKLLNEAIEQLKVYVQDDRLKEIKNLKKLVISYTYGEFQIKEVEL